MFWPNVGRRYLDLFTQVASVGDATVGPRYRDATGTPELIPGAM
jgi:hypothetical protein